MITEHRETTDVDVEPEQMRKVEINDNARVLEPDHKDTDKETRKSTGETVKGSNAESILGRTEKKPARRAINTGKDRLGQRL